MRTKEKEKKTLLIQIKIGKEIKSLPQLNN